MTQICIVCGSKDSTLLEKIQKEKIKLQYLDTYGELPPSLNIPDELLECRKCNLQFFPQAKSGDSHYYNWIVKNESYPKARWEFTKTIKYLKRYQSNLPFILEIGSGSGNFAQRLTLSGFDVVCIENNELAVDLITDKDLKVYEAIDKLPKIYQSPDFVVFHQFLEHIEDPLEFIINIRNFLNNPTIIFSVPNRDLFDTSSNHLDYPPHHLTRWNMEAIGNLLDRSGYIVAQAELQKLSLRSHAYHIQGQGLFFKGIRYLAGVTGLSYLYLRFVKKEIQRRHFGHSILVIATPVFFNC